MEKLGVETDAQSTVLTYIEYRAVSMASSELLTPHPVSTQRVEKRSTQRWTELSMRLIQFWG
jgi:hypothetical protein